VAVGMPAMISVVGSIMTTLSKSHGYRFSTPLTVRVSEICEYI
jgi:hypothetical protein